MDFKNINIMKIDSWNRKTISSFWLICLLYVIGEFLILFLRIRYYPDYQTWPYVRNQMIIPDLALALVMVFTELYYRFGKKHREEMILICSFLLADTVFLTISPILSGGDVVLLLPLIVSIFYFNIRMLFATLPVNLATFAITYYLSPIRQQYMSIFEFYMFVLMLIGFTIAGYRVIRRGQDLLKPPASPMSITEVSQ